MYMVSNKAEAKLRGWGKINCLDHKQMYWRFDGKFLRNENGKYVARKKEGAYFSILVDNPWNIDRDKNFENEGLFWEYDPASYLIGSTTEPRVYLSKIGERLWAREKLEDDTETQGNEALEQRFLLDYKGNTAGLILDIQIYLFSDSEVLRRR